MAANHHSPYAIVGHFQSRMNELFARALIVVAFCGLSLTTGCGSNADQPVKPVSAETAAAYDQHLARANTLFKEDKLEAALAETASATKLDSSRYEAYATAALILHASGKSSEVQNAVDQAALRVPPEKLAQVQAIAALVGATVQARKSQTQEPTPTSDATNDQLLSGAARRQFNSLMLIIDEAQQATEVSNREKLLQEFQDKSAEFVKENPSSLQIWSLRAAAALELNQVQAGWEAGQNMIRLDADFSRDATTQTLMARLQRKGWLGKKPPAPSNRVSSERSIARPETTVVEPGPTQVQLKAAEASRIKSEINTLEGQRRSLAAARINGANEASEHGLTLEEAQAIVTKAQNEIFSSRSELYWRYNDLKDEAKRLGPSHPRYEETLARADQVYNDTRAGAIERLKPDITKVEELKTRRRNPSKEEQALEVRISELAAKLKAIESQTR